MAKRLRIALFNDSFFPLSDGVLMVVDNYARRLSQYADVTVFVPGYKNKPDNREYPYKVVRCYKGISSDHIGYSLALTFLDSNWKKELYGNDFDIVHIHTPFTVSRSGLHYAKKHNIPVVATMHTQFWKDIYRSFHSKLAANVINHDLIRIFNSCDECWAVNEAVANIYHDEYHYKTLPRVVRNATEMKPLADPDAARRRINQLYGIQEDEFVFLFVGRINTNKNIFFIADAVSKLRRMVPEKKFKMIFVGDGPDEEKFIKHLHRTGDESDFILTGRVTDRELLAQLYARGDLFLFPSLYDCSSIVQIEAASQATPPLFLYGAATASTATEDVNAFFCENDTDAYAKKMLDIMENPSRLKEISANAQRDLYLNWDMAVDQAYARYQELIELKKKS